MSNQLSSDLESLRIDRDADPDHKHPLTYLVAAGLALAVLAAALLLGVPYLRTRMVTAEVQVTEVALVSPAQAQVELTSTGYVVPQIVSQVAAKVPGKVAAVHVKQGDAVQAGDLLISLELVDQKAAIAAARARVAAAQAAVETSRAQAAEARQLARRAEELAGRGAGPQAAVEDSAARLAALEAAVLAAAAQVRAAQAEVRALEINLASYEIRAPISGTIIGKPPEIGEIVGPAMSGIAAQVGGIELADLSTLAVETDVPEARLHLVTVAGPAEIALDAFPERRYRGTVRDIVPRVNRAKAAVTVKVGFVDDPQGVLPDMSARVSFLSGALDAEQIKQAPRVVVPATAVVDRGTGKAVFVVEGDRVRLKPVTLAARYGSGFEMTAGPEPGARLVRDPPASLRDGQRVKERVQ
jgi:HlyD family secretion protein